MQSAKRFACEYYEVMSLSLLKYGMSRAMNANTLNQTISLIKLRRRAMKTFIVHFHLPVTT